MVLPSEDSPLLKPHSTAPSVSEGISTNLPELVLPRSPLEVLRTAAAFLNRGPKGVGLKIRGGLTPGGGEGHAMVLEAR